MADAHAVADTTPDVVIEAMEICCNHHFASWDAIILATAVQAGCRLLLSEDMHHGFVWRGLMVPNPFVAQAP